MPTYQYRCLKCKNEFEIKQKMTEEPLQKCPECRGKIKRLVSAGAGIIFKGSGFYSTDYRSEGYKKQAKSESQSTPSSGSTESSSTTSTTTKTETKTTNANA